MVRLCDAGALTRNIQMCLRNDRGVVLPKNNLYDVRQATIFKTLDGRTPMNALVQKFR